MLIMGRPFPLRDADAPVLSQRQREVLQLLTEGFSMKQVASELGIATQTVVSINTGSWNTIISLQRPTSSGLR